MHKDLRPAAGASTDLSLNSQPEHPDPQGNQALLLALHAASRCADLEELGLWVGARLGRMSRL